MHTPRFFKQAFVYGFIGGSCLVADVLLYGILTRFFGLHYLFANSLSFLVIAWINFLANRRFTFGVKGRAMAHQFAKFFLIAIVGVSINTLCLGILVHQFYVHDLVAKCAAAGVVFFWNFGMNRFWTFREGKQALFFDPL